MMSLVALLIIFAVVIGSAGMVGLFAYVIQRISRVERGGLGDAGADQLLDQVRELREDLMRVESEVSALTERVDFTDKLLMSGEDPEGADRNP